MKVKTKALRYVDVECENMRQSIGVEYNKYEQHVMYCAYIQGYKQALQDIKNLHSISEIKGYIKEILA